MVVAEFISFSNSVGFGTLAIIVALAVVAFLNGRRDGRYEIAAGERDEWRQKSERQAEEIKGQLERIHTLDLQVKEIQGEMRLLEAMPQVSELYALLSEHDKRSAEFGHAMTETLQGVQQALHESALAMARLGEHTP